MGRNLTKDELDFFKETIIDNEKFSFENFKKDYEHINGFIENNIKQHLSNHDESKIFNFDALYNFRTIWMIKLMAMKNFGDIDYGKTIGTGPSLMQIFYNGQFCFNDGIKSIDIGDDIWKCLEETDNKIVVKEIPYNYFFINKIIKIKEGIYCYGIACLNCIDKRTMEPANQLYLLGYDFNDDAEWRDSIGITKEGIADHTDLELFKNITQKEWEPRIAEIFCNVIDLLNHPEVETKIIDWENNKKRIQKFKFPIPSKIKINITGKLKRYIYEELPKQKEVNKIKHRFWVRGHFMNFHNDCYKNMKGKSKWVLPYIKGRGELTNKNYTLGNSNEWEHQKQMVLLLRDIYFDKKIRTNIRTILNGLEIDCYIPELKLGFEYNGEQHYNWIKEFHKTEEEFNAQKERDIKKNLIAKEKGITLITIRYDETLSKELILNKLKEVGYGKSD